ncbi:MAG: nucleotidyltransferase domain-containing protein [Candidatus Nezhaarchaeota archaeon]|nr:nucleotidyltransferase domain-containing protein [Candidatus Nezhaarchaeota archaeon]
MSFDLYIEEGLRALRAMRDYLEVAKRVKEIALEHAPDAKVYVFGSVVEGKYTAGSDIDILVVTSIEEGEAYEMKARMYKEVDAPIQVHVAKPAQLQWYTRFISKLVEV